MKSPSKKRHAAVCANNLNSELKKTGNSAQYMSEMRRAMRLSLESCDANTTTSTTTGKRRSSGSRRKSSGTRRSRGSRGSSGRGSSGRRSRSSSGGGDERSPPPVHPGSSHVKSSTVLTPQELGKRGRPSHHHHHHHRSLKYTDTSSESLSCINSSAVHHSEDRRGKNGRQSKSVRSITATTSTSQVSTTSKKVKRKSETELKQPGRKSNKINTTSKTFDQVSRKEGEKQNRLSRADIEDIYKFKFAMKRADNAADVSGPRRSGGDCGDGGGGGSGVASRDEGMMDVSLNTTPSDNTADLFNFLLLSDSSRMPESLNRFRPEIKQASSSIHKHSNNQKQINSKLYNDITVTSSNNADISSENDSDDTLTLTPSPPRPRAISKKSSTKQASKNSVNVKRKKDIGSGKKSVEIHCQDAVTPTSRSGLQVKSKQFSKKADSSSLKNLPSPISQRKDKSSVKSTPSKTTPKNCSSASKSSLKSTSHSPRKSPTKSPPKTSTKSPTKSPLKSSRSKSSIGYTPDLCDVNFGPLWKPVIGATQSRSFKNLLLEDVKFLKHKVYTAEEPTCVFEYMRKIEKSQRVKGIAVICPHVNPENNMDYEDCIYECEDQLVHCLGNRSCGIRVESEAILLHCKEEHNTTWQQPRIFDNVIDLPSLNFAISEMGGLQDILYRDLWAHVAMKMGANSSMCSQYAYKLLADISLRYLLSYINLTLAEKLKFRTLARRRIASESYIQYRQTYSMDYCQVVNFSRKTKKSICHKFKYDNPDKCEYFEIDEEDGAALKNREEYFWSIVNYSSVYTTTRKGYSTKNKSQLTTPKSSNSIKKNYWNLNYIRRHKKNIIRMKNNSKEIQMKMMFSAECFQENPSSTYTLHYLHNDGQLIWYSIDQRDKAKYHDLVEQKFLEDKKIFKEITREHYLPLISPMELQASDIRCCHHVHNQYEYVLTFPGSIVACVALTLSFVESVRVEMDE